ncbi:DnaD domain protein [Lentilactobacillus parabuchneri]|uniref:DnaD domain protein n=1 Tax=Lentilactobacillus parabuchneri TaxID=152331 RepID=UPI002235D90E|nr:DnaD domain protein [Lentilactobacillus parabuchneri]MCW4398074.1 DnaD domain protein [Lentilactobacillus parabuchneri]
MNYIQQIRAFDDFKLYKARLSSGEIALWHALMSINNKTGWQEWFTAANSMLVSLSGLSRSGILKDRNVLKQIGLIDFRTNGKKATSYHVCVLYTSDSAQDSKHQSKQNSKHSSKQDSNTLYKLNETKQKQVVVSPAREEFSHATKSFELWQSLWGFPNAVAQQDLQEWAQEFTPDLLNHVIEYAGRRNVQARAADNYIDRVLQSYRQHQPPITTVAQAKKEELSHYNRTSEDFGRSQKYRYEAKPEPIRTPQKGDEPF